MNEGNKRLVCVGLVLIFLFTVTITHNIKSAAAVEAAAPVIANDGYQCVPMFELQKSFGTWDWDFSYSADPNDIAHHVANGYHNYYHDGVFYISPVQVAPLIPLYRMYNASNHDHIFTTDINEINYAASSAGYTLEGLVGYVAPPNVSLPRANPVHRNFHDEWTCHTYGFSKVHVFEREHPGIYEGIPFQAFTIHGDNYTESTPVVGVPASPSGLTATAPAGNKVVLKWNNSSQHDKGIGIARKKAGSSYQVIATVKEYKDTFTDTTVMQSTSYTYKVIAYNDYGDSTPSNEVSITTPAITSPAPNTPSKLTGVALSKTAIKLTWKDNSSDESGFSVERKKNNSGYVLMTVLGSNKTSFIDKSVQAKTTYGYRIRAWAGAKPSNPSNEITVKTPGGYILGGTPNNLQQMDTGLLPKAPTGLSAVAGSGKRVNLSWNDNANNENTYRIERFNGQSFAQIAAVQANTKTFTDDGVSYGNANRYRVKAVNSAGASVYSNEAEITIYGSMTGSTAQVVGTSLPIQLPTAPSSLQAWIVSNSVVSLTWSDNSNNESGFEIERKASGGTYQKISCVPTGAGGFVNVGLTTSVPYTYRVRAWNSAGYSAYSNEVVSSAGSGIVNKRPSGTINTIPTNNSLNSGSGQATLPLPNLGGKPSLIQPLPLPKS